MLHIFSNICLLFAPFFSCFLICRLILHANLSPSLLDFSYSCANWSIHRPKLLGGRGMGGERREFRWNRNRDVFLAPFFHSTVMFIRVNIITHHLRNGISDNVHNSYKLARINRENKSKTMKRFCSFLHITPYRKGELLNGLFGEMQKRN